MFQRTPRVCEIPARKLAVADLLHNGCRNVVDKQAMLQTSCRLADRKFSCDRYGVLMEAAQQRWNRACATARRLLPYGDVGGVGAEDLVQEAHLSFLRNGHDDRHMKRKLWFLQRTLLKDHLRRPKSLPIDEQLLLSPERGWRRADVLESIRACRLSPRATAVFEGLLMGLTRREIAGRLGLTTMTVDWIVRRWRDVVAAEVRHVGRSRGRDGCRSGCGSGGDR
jgi:DNA-directed RNA polymerase specialized sigma24 family protein